MNELPKLGQEIIATAQIFDHATRLHSFEITAEVMKEINDSNHAASTIRSPARQTA